MEALMDVRKLIYSTLLSTSSPEIKEFRISKRGAVTLCKEETQLIERELRQLINFIHTKYGSCSISKIEDPTDIIYRFIS